MAFRKFQQAERQIMTAATQAMEFVRGMIAHETTGWGDQKQALERLARRYGLPFWTLDHIRTGRAKTVEAGLMGRIRAAYMDLCERQIARLQHEIAMAKALGTDDALESIEAQALALAEEAAARKAAIGGGK